MEGRRKEYSLKSKEVRVEEVTCLRTYLGIRHLHSAIDAEG